MVNSDGDPTLGMHDCDLESSRDDTVRSSVLILQYKIPNSKFNIHIK